MISARARFKDVICCGVPPDDETRWTTLLLEKTMTFSLLQLPFRFGPGASQIFSGVPPSAPTVFRNESEKNPRLLPSGDQNGANAP